MIVGLGNPGNKYSETRHNVGFKVVENLARKRNLKFEKVSKNYAVAKGEAENSAFSLLLPLTYMNLSGLAVNEFHSNFDFDFQNMLVVCDDINLPLGKIRLRAKGSHGGHNGLLSIINEIKTTDFPRLRIGIGNNFDKDKQAEYVLSPFTDEEKSVINLSIENAVEICDYFLVGGLKIALEYFSRLQKTQNSNPTKNGVTNG
ncbi:MAG: aminoacyl-tRNA hydrolase [Ignavibacteria bacterium]|nr:aminoacyl-tRNA hydrolase [Ignavibacteria bacterium]MDH7528838.1 aminoacyl-tRNA hydrolase [Ignavibacteria bacterium]